MSKLRLGVLGLGEGRSIISAALDSELWELAQMCDLNEELCKERAAEFRFPRYTTQHGRDARRPDDRRRSASTRPIRCTPTHIRAVPRRRQARHLHQAADRQPRRRAGADRGAEEVRQARLRRPEHALLRADDPPARRLRRRQARRSSSPSRRITTPTTAGSSRRPGRRPAG